MSTSKIKEATKKRGRPKKLNVLREPNGRISRAKHKANEHAIKVRAEKYNLTFKQAKDPRSQNWIGRLTFLGSTLGLSENQYKAGETYLRLYKNYQKAIASPGAYYETESGTQNFYTEEEQIEWAKRICTRFKKVNEEIKRAQNKYPNENLLAAVQYCLLEDLEIPHILGSLRIVLNTLYHYFFAAAQHKFTQRKPIKLNNVGKYYAPVDILQRDLSLEPLKTHRLHKIYY